MSSHSICAQSPFALWAWRTGEAAWIPKPCDMRNPGKRRNELRESKKAFITFSFIRFKQQKEWRNTSINMREIFIVATSIIAKGKTSAK